MNKSVTIFVKTHIKINKTLSCNFSYLNLFYHTQTIYSLSCFFHRQSLPSLISFVINHRLCFPSHFNSFFDQLFSLKDYLYWAEMVFFRLMPFWTFIFYSRSLNAFETSLTNDLMPVVLWLTFNSSQI